MPHASDQPLDDEWARRVSAGVAAGSRDALRDLYEARWRLVYERLRLVTRRDHEFALDAMQDAWMRALRRMPPLPDLASLDRWIDRTALTAALDRIRAERRRVLREGTSRARNGTSDDEAIEELRAALVALSDSDRSVIGLRFGRMLSLAGLGETLGIEAGAAQMRLARALRRLRNRLGKGDGKDRHDEP